MKKTDGIPELVEIHNKYACGMVTFPEFMMRAIPIVINSQEVFDALKNLLSADPEQVEEWEKAVGLQLNEPH